MAQWKLNPPRCNGPRELTLVSQPHHALMNLMVEINIRKYKQNVLILELDKKAMLQAGGAIMASGDPCRTVLTGKKKHANEPTSEETNTADPRDENRDTLTEVNTEEEETKCLAGKNVEDLNPSSEKKDVPDIGKNLKVFFKGSRESKMDAYLDHSQSS
mmetsp:Transcript_13784/g.16473  ORF Transcript_13784/g.16473 Transcript_13784/m.16473 type:complete len:159 (+) Transcript_13784:79-555(+)